MKVTGCLREKNGIYHMVVRVPDINGISKQKSKFTNIKTKGANQRETRANKIKADRMLAQWLETLSLAESYGGDQDFITAATGISSRPSRNGLRKRNGLSALTPMNPISATTTSTSSPILNRRSFAWRKSRLGSSSDMFAKRKKAGSPARAFASTL